MDEPSEGLAAQIVAGVARTMARGRGQVERGGGTDFLRLALLTDDIAILDCGRVVFLGTTAELKGSDAIIARRLGVD
jgi:ABC-type branched-subunit amino acid transport system ATPase component